MPKDLRHFIAYVEKHDSQGLVKVTREVDPRFEVTGVARKLLDEGRTPAVLCEKVKGYKLPIITNIFASRRRLASILETTEERVRETLLKAAETYVQPRIVGDGPVKEVVRVGDRVDLRELPIPTHSEKDGGPYITAGVTLVRDPDTGIRNAGIYRVMYLDERTVSLLPTAPTHLHSIFKKAEERGRPLEAVTFIGHHPACVMGAEHAGDELGMMGSLLGEPVDLVKAETVDLEVPTRAEIALEGRLMPGVRVMDGPLGEYTFTYGGKRSCLRYEVTALTHRENPIYHDIYSGSLDHINIYIFMTEIDILRRAREAAPQLLDVRLPTFGVGHIAFVKVKSDAGEAGGIGKQAALAVLSANMYLRTAVVVDEDVDIDDPNQILWALATRTKSERDIDIIRAGFTFQGADYKIIIDLTKPSEGDFPEKCDPPREIWQKIRLNECLAED